MRLLRNGEVDAVHQLMLQKELRILKYLEHINSFRSIDAVQQK